MNSFIVSLYNFQVKDHFNSSHKGESFYAYSSANKCQTCYQGPFQNFPELLEHLAFNHPESIDKFKEDNFKSEEEKIGTKPSIKRRKKQQQSEVLNPLHHVQDRPKGKATAGQIVKNTSKKTSGGKRLANYEKENDSDKEVDLSNIENDPNESTYCLCEKVRNFFTFYIYRDPFF